VTSLIATFLVAVTRRNVRYGVTFHRGETGEALALEPLPQKPYIFRRLIL
jgi:hypothetical protein